MQPRGLRQVRVRLSEWTTRRRLLTLALIAVPVLLVATVSYFSIALPGCASCHDQAAFKSATAASAHANVPCVSCHVSRTVAGRVTYGFREAFHMVLPLWKGTGREWAAVPDERCLACHKKVLEGPSTVSGMRIDHSTCAVGSRCTDCHSATAHRDQISWVRTYDMDTCLECHVSKASTACDLCHVEGRRAADRITSGIFAVTHGADWQKTHGMGNSATCVVCHTAATCEKCHGPGLPHDAKFISTHTTYATAPGAKCDGCHEKSFCDGCHGLQMPHSTEFKRKHATEAAADRALCDRCHSAADCTTCHVKHVHPGGAIGNFPNRPQGGGQ